MDSSRAKYRFGASSRIDAEAVGEPGKRTFKLTLQAGAASAILWLEKEQLFQLGTHIQGIVSSLSSEEKERVGEAPEAEWNSGITNLDFKDIKLALGHDASSNTLLFLVHDAEENDDDTATLSFWTSLKQGEALGEAALRVCAAGRPQCFLCGQPMDPDGHWCPRSNGHAPLEI